MKKALNKKEEKVINKILKNLFEGKIRIESVELTDSGHRKIFFDYDEDFIQWFKDSQGMKRWSRKRFESIIVEEYRKHLDKYVSLMLF